MATLVVGGLANGAIYGLIAVGIVLVFRSTGIVSFAQGEVLMVGAYAYLVATRVHINGFSEFLVVLLVGALLGLVFFIVTHVLMPKADELNVVIATLGLSVIMINLVRFYFPEPAYKPPVWLVADQSIETSAGLIQASSLLALGVGLAAMVALYCWFKFTQIGLAMRAVATDRTLAAQAGIPVVSMLILSWALGSAFATVGGLLLGPPLGVYPLMGRDLLFKAFIAATLGGFDSPVGAVVGGLLLGVAEVAITASVGGEARDIVIFVALFIVLIVKPSGLFGSRTLRRA
jgi:branched-chain amino acid transport system permease protein